MDRLRICVDIARGLDHLHNHVGEHQTIIHWDIKSANILLDHNWVVKVSDLGLSKLSLAGLEMLLFPMLVEHRDIVNPNIFLVDCDERIRCLFFRNGSS